MYEKVKKIITDNYNNRDKYKQTCTEIYGDGVINAFQANIVKEKSKNTKYDRYGDPHYNNAEKVKQTNQKNLGVDYPLKSQVIRDKITQNIINTYGVDNPAKSPIIKEHKKLRHLCILAWAEISSPPWICRSVQQNGHRTMWGKRIKRKPPVPSGLCLRQVL